MDTFIFNRSSPSSSFSKPLAALLIRHETRVSNSVRVPRPSASSLTEGRHSPKLRGLPCAFGIQNPRFAKHRPRAGRWCALRSEIKEEAAGRGTFAEQSTPSACPVTLLGNEPCNHYKPQLTRLIFAHKHKHKHKHKSERASRNHKRVNRIQRDLKARAC